MAASVQDRLTPSDAVCCMPGNLTKCSAISSTKLKVVQNCTGSIWILFTAAVTYLMRGYEGLGNTVEVIGVLGDSVMWLCV
jgi:hypothetical protein